MRYFLKDNNRKHRVWIYPGYPRTRARAPRETDGLIRTNQPMAKIMEDPIRTLTVSQQVTSLTPPRKSEHYPSQNCYMSRVWGVSPAASGAYSRVLETWREQPEPHICGAVSASNSRTSKATLPKSEPIYHQITTCGRCGVYHLPERGRHAEKQPEPLPAELLSLNLVISKVHNL